MSANFNNYNREQLIDYIESLRRQLSNEKYGLYFDRKANPEEIVELCKMNIPIFRHNEKFDILNDGEENIVIEGDNYQALLTLNMIFSKPFVDLIYIDPPYNTRNKDFIYNDDRIDLEDGYRHTKWLTFMEKRLKLAKSLLKENGLIFISIDDNEQAQLKLLMDHIFGEQNFVTTFIIDKTAQGANQSTTFKTQHEFLHCYAKNIFEADTNYEFESERDEKKIKFKDEIGWYAITNSFDSINSPLTSNKNRGYTVYYNPSSEDAITRDEYDKEQNFFRDFDHELIDKGYIPIRPGVRKGVQYPWNWTMQRFVDTYSSELVFSKNRKGDWAIYHKNRFSGLVKDTSIKKFDTRKYGNQHLVNILGKKAFDYPKSIDMMKWVVSKLNSKDIVVLDFFAGSGTTAEAVLELNKEDDGSRRFIICNNDENNVMTNVCYPRVKTIITGKRGNGTSYSKGINANVRYFETAFVEKIKDDHETSKYNLLDQINDLLCIKQNIFEKIITNSNSHFMYVNSRLKKLMIIYLDIYDSDKLNNVIEDINRSEFADYKSVIYVFSRDNNVDIETDRILREKSSAQDIQPIPSNIYEIYRKTIDEIDRRY